MPPSAAPRVKALLHKSDFERVLATPSCSRSAHFAVHHVSGRPSGPRRRPPRAAAQELSTVPAPVVQAPVDDLPAAAPEQGPVQGQWAGCVVPKRHAKRAVTRNLLKRQIRAALDRHSGQLAQGLWLVRLRSPFAPAQFPSAASLALRRTVRAELDTLLARLAQAARVPS